LAAPDGANVTPAATKRASVKAAAKKAQAKSVVKKAAKAKYQDDAGHSWSGFGPRPKWLKDAIAGGKNLEDFLG
jgi:DNA-binding protein H-NS